MSNMRGMISQVLCCAFLCVCVCDLFLFSQVVLEVCGQRLPVHTRLFTPDWYDLQVNPRRIQNKLFSSSVFL